MAAPVPGKGGDLSEDAAFMDLYSRQIGAFGMETMTKLIKLRVVIVGLKGLGVEVAKNLTLAGPGAITLVDPEPAQIADVGTNFFLREEDAAAGTPRAEAVLPRLRELNKGVDLKTAKKLDRDLVASHDVLVMTEGSREEFLEWDAFCRNHTETVKGDKLGDVTVAKPIQFIGSLSRGAAGFVFSDFGPGFKCNDKSGEPPKVRVITSITCAKEGLVTLLGPDEDGEMHDLDEDDHEGFVEFSDVRGMAAKDTDVLKKYGLNINASGPWKIKRRYEKKMRNGKEVSVLDPYSFYIGDTTAFTEYSGGGFIKQYRVPAPIKHVSLAESLRSPTDFALPSCDEVDFMAGNKLHLAQQALWEYQARNEGKLPAVGDAAAADEVVAIAKEINAAYKVVNAINGWGSALALDEVDEDKVRALALYADTELQPVSTFFGGIVAQEVVKVCGKFTPISQWMHYDAFSVLPEERPADAGPAGSRYDHLYSIFGKAYVEKMQNMRTFMVGCGALGCEFLKNFAMLGFSTGKDGLIITTDNDRIEVSNLNRQFLFREHNVGQAKSKAAAAAAAEMNAAVKVDARELLVCPDTESTFNNDFWRSLDFVTNALDNIKARVYVDGKCVRFSKMLLESGTLGTKCNVQVVVPGYSQSYADGDDINVKEKHIPMCTLHNFPNLIDHCIQWARAMFTDFFVEPFTTFSTYARDPEAFLAELKKAADNPSDVAKGLDTMRAVKAQADILAGGVTFDALCRVAYGHFHALFRDKIQSLIDQFPRDAVTKEGAPFWTKGKRFPTPAAFDIDNADHLDFIITTANLLAVGYGLVPPPETELLPKDHPWRSKATVAAALAGVAPPEYKKQTVKLEGDDEDKKDGAEESKAAGGDDLEAVQAEFDSLMKELAALDTSKWTPEPADFEKDQDLNFHIDFVTAGANLRAVNYEIAPTTRHEAKMISGRIIPAIATTTASVTGLVMLEMLKLAGGKKPTAFRNSSNNLGVNTFQMFEVSEAHKATKFYSDADQCDVFPKPEGFTKWDKTVISGTTDTTVKEFTKMLEDKTGLNLDMLYHKCADIPGKSYSSKFIVGGKNYGNSKMVDVLKELYADAGVPGDDTAVELTYELIDDDDKVYRIPTLYFEWA